MLLWRLAVLAASLLFMGCTASLIRVKPRHSTADTAKDSGTVVLNVCVDTSGIIQSTVLNVDKSTTVDPVMVDKALSKTKEMRFAPTKSGATQCGDIRFKFKLKKP